MTDAFSIPHLLDVSPQNGATVDHVVGEGNGMGEPADEAGVADLSVVKQRSPPVVKCNGGVGADVNGPVVEGAVAMPSDSVVAVSAIPAEQVAEPEEIPALLAMKLCLHAPAIATGLNGGEEAVPEPLAGMAEAPVEAAPRPTGGVVEEPPPGLPAVTAGAQAEIKTEVVPAAEKNELERILDELIR